MADWVHDRDCACQRSHELPEDMTYCCHCQQPGKRVTEVRICVYRLPSRKTITRYLHRYPNCIDPWQEKFETWKKSVTG